MSNGEWRPKAGEEGDAILDESQLRRMMRDPRYWRAREPEFVRRVTEGFRRLVERPAAPAPKLPTPTPREPWEVLREAAELIGSRWGEQSYTRLKVLELAASWEAAARPAPPPTLAEAVKQYKMRLLSDSREGISDAWLAVEEALARAEAGQ